MYCIVVVAAIANSNALQYVEPQGADTGGNSPKASGLAGSSQVSQLTSKSWKASDLALF